MKYNPDIHHRQSIRLKGYDYSEAGAYFVTVCTNDGACLFGNVANEEMRLNDAGRKVEECWQEIPGHFPHADLDAFVVMPNHVHGIVVIGDGRGTACRAPTVEQFGRPVHGSIPTVIRSFKSAATGRINGLRNTPGGKLWQRNYYEHVIRNENELNQIREYIINNPMKWDLDKENPNVWANSAMSMQQQKSTQQDEPWQL